MLQGPEGNATGVGVQLRPRTAQKTGPVQEVQAGTGWMSVDSPVRLLTAPEPIVSIEVRWPGTPAKTIPVPAGAVEVEVDSLEQLDEVLQAGADLVLLDNFTVPDLRAAVARNAGQARLEASGGLSLEVARKVAETGVDYLAVGALTHSAPVLDIGADLRQVSDAAGH